jgi:hypothetical protein
MQKLRVQLLHILTTAKTQLKFRMHFILKYKLIGEDSTQENKITPEQYYEVFEPNENFEKDCIAKYNAEKFYIKMFKEIDLNKLEFTSIELINSEKSDFITKTNYFGHETQIVYRKDKNGFELIIQTIQVTTNTIVITRMERENNLCEWKNIDICAGVNFLKNQNEEWYSIKTGKIINHLIPI